MKNRILKIAFFLPTLNVGGIERVFITYANSLSEFYDVEFVLCKKEGILLKELSFGIMGKIFKNMDKNNLSIFT